MERTPSLAALSEPCADRDEEMGATSAPTGPRIGGRPLPTGTSAPSLTDRPVTGPIGHSASGTAAIGWPGDGDGGS